MGDAGQIGKLCALADLLPGVEGDQMAFFSAELVPLDRVKSAESIKLYHAHWVPRSLHLQSRGGHQPSVGLHGNGLVVHLVGVNITWAGGAV